MNKLTVDLIIEYFNEIAMYYVIQEDQSGYDMLDLQCKERFNVDKFTWVEKIYNYYKHEFKIENHGDQFYKNQVLGVLSQAYEDLESESE